MIEFENIVQSLLNMCLYGRASPGGLGTTRETERGESKVRTGGTICQVVILVGILHVHLPLIRFGYVLEIVALSLNNKFKGFIMMKHEQNPD